MRTLKDLLKRLLCWALLLALLVLAAAGTVLGVQGWKLYRGTQPELPAAQLYETLSARPGFTTCDAIPQTYIDAVIAVEDSRFELHHGVDPVAIVRALCMHPEILLLDEITAALDPEMVREVLDVVLSLAKAGSTMVIVTHEMNFARAIADRILFIENGTVVEQSDDPKAFFASPETDRAKAFLKSFDYE